MSFPFLLVGSNARVSSRVSYPNCGAIRSYVSWKRIAKSKAEQGIAANEPQASWWWNGQSAAGTVWQVQILGRLMAGFLRSAQKVSAFSMITLFPSFPHRPYTRFTIPSGVLMSVYRGFVQFESWKNVISPSTLSVGVLTGVSSPHPARNKQRSRTRRGRGDPEERGSQVFWVSVFSIGLVGLRLLRALLGRLRCFVRQRRDDCKVGDFPS